MSYKTNPIANRIKINKGWKNPYFPIKALNYSRDISLWFKVYLLLKAFLHLKKIQLVSYEIRFDQQNKKILYLRINKKGKRKKKRKKKKTALHKILKKIRTPLLKNRNSGSIFFLYKDLVGLKKLSFWNKNVGQKKILSKFWLTKPKISTWINTLEKITFIRQNTKKEQHYYKKNQNFLPLSQVKLKFYTNKQKQILAQMGRVKKKIFLLNIKFFELIQQKKTKNLQILIQNLKKEIFRNRTQIQKLSNFYQFLIYSLQNFSKKKIIKKELKKKSFLDSVERKKLILFWKALKKKFNSLNRARFFRQLFKKNTILKKITHFNFLINQMSENNVWIKNQFLFLNFHNKFRSFLNPLTKKVEKKLWHQNLLMKAFLKKQFAQNNQNLILKQKITNEFFYNIALSILLRRKKKKKIKGFESWFFRKKFKKFRKNLRFNVKLKAYTQYNNFLEKNKFLSIENQNQFVNQIKKINRDLQSNRIAKYYKYRLPYRRMRFNFQQLNVSFKLKYLIQDFVQAYFHVQVEAKIEHVLNANKNLKFFRLIFSVRKKKKNQLIKKKRLDTWNQKQMFLISRLNLITSSKKKTKNKIKRKKQAQGKKIAIPNWKQELTKTNAIKTLKKKEFLLLAEKKRLRARMRNYFSHVKRAKDFKQIFKYFIPTLMEFSRSFDPQLLADILSKVILKTKKQTKMLKNIKRLLLAIQLPRHIGYKIVLTGRINSKKKSRLIYITRKRITLQVFENYMNYAYAQANARIGAFGVKIWVYSKKNWKNEKNHSLTSE